MNISVIIPVYNAAPFIEKAVLSALEQTPVREVILIEDGSKDESLSICKRLEMTFDQVKLICHANYKNRGPGASRNIGLQTCTCDYIAFLDADDYYLPDRFSKTTTIFNTHPEADGVYEAIGVTYYDVNKQIAFEKTYGDNVITMVREKVKPSQLFELLLLGEKGWFHLDGLLIKRSIIDKVGLFDETLEQGQDTDFIFRLSLVGKLYSGDLKKVVAVRGIHNNNRIFDKKIKLHSKIKLYKKWFNLMLDKTWSARINRFVLKKHIAYAPILNKRKLYPGFSRPLKLLYGVYLFVRFPKLICKLF